MSLYFTERMNEQTEDHEKDNIVFTYPWIISNTTENGEELNYIQDVRTSYQFLTTTWTVDLTSEGITVFNAGNGSSCFVSYNMYYDDDMRFLFHSSSRIKMTKERNAFRTPDGFTTKIVEAVAAEDISKIVVYVELHQPLKWFYRPFDNPAHVLCETGCDEYPKDMENNFKFMFLKISDYSIKCLNGSVPASKMVLNATSAYMKDHFEKSNDNELVVEYSTDVVKPVVYYLHSVCFEMPPSYDFEYVHRLYSVIIFFQPLNVNAICKAVQKSLCRKLAEENVTNFDLLLRYLSLAHKHGFLSLANMISTIIATKYYFKWHATFPENARNAGNQIFRDVFGVERNGRYGLRYEIFRMIEDSFKGSLETNVILS